MTAASIDREWSRVLIVEDDLSQLRTLSALFEREGFLVTPCGSRAEVVEQIENEQFAVAVLDLRLSGSDGSELLEAFHVKCPKTRVIVNTAYGSFQSAKKAIDFGAFAYIEKASHPTELLNQVHRAIKDHLAEKLRESEIQLHLITDNLPAHIAYVDSEQRYRFVNPMYAKWIGRSPEEIIGRQVSEVVGEQVYQEIAGRIEEALAGKSIAFDSWLSITEGARQCFSVKYVPHFEADEKVYGFFALLTDISDRKRAEDALKESEERYRAIFEQAADSILVIDAATGALLDFNERAHENLGYTREEFAELKIPDFEAVESAEEVAKHTESIVREGADTFETKHGTKDGEIRDVLVSSRAISVGEREFVVSICSDITDRKRAEEELRQHQEKLAHVARLSTMGEMATGLAHELNQPLAVIANYCYIGKQTLAKAGSADREEFRDLFEKLTGQAMRAGEIIRRLRGLIDKRTSVRSRVDVVKPIQEVLQLLESDLRQSEVRVELQADHSNRVAIIDEIQIQQVLVNLFRNAVDAMSEMERDQRTLKITSRERDDELIEVAVSDTGKGIPVESADQIFDAFFSSKSDGMGMGLAINRTIIESHGGRLWVTPNSDRGVTFHFTVPIA